jgi:hypothetical protein
LQRLAIFQMKEWKGKIDCEAPDETPSGDVEVKAGSLARPPDATADTTPDNP